MIYGISTSLFRGRELADALRAAAEAGFRQVELLCADHTPGEWYRDPDGTRRLLQRYGLRARTVHSHPAGWNNAASDPAERLASIEAAARSFGPAVEVGAETVVVHANAAAGGTEYTDEGFASSRRRSVDSLGQLADRAARAGVRLAVENLPARKRKRPSADMRDLLDMIRGLGDRVGVCLDTGHANSNASSAAEEARLAGPKIFAVHLQDNDGMGEDQHLFPGEGTVDFESLLQALDERAPGAVRTFEPSPSEEAEEALKRLGRLVGDWNHREREAAK